MRSETAPTWVGFAIGFGVALVVVAVFALAKGEMKVVSSVIFRRDTQPVVFWAAVIISAVVGVATLAYAIPISGRADRNTMQSTPNSSCRT